MEVTSEHRLMEVGKFPSDWDVAPLGTRATFRTGPFGSALHKSDYTSDGIPVINPMHIVSGRLVPTQAMTITEQAAQTLADYRMSPGEVIIGRRGDMGRCAVVREHNAGWLCGTGSMLIRPQAIDAEFLQRALSSPRTVAAIEDSSVGTTMINLNRATLSGLKLQFPPLPEQRAIAKALRDMDALLGGLDQLIAKKRNLKQAAMQQLLTGDTRLPGFHEEWRTAEFGDVAMIRNAKVMGREVPAGTPCVELDSIGQGSGRLLSTTDAAPGSSKYRFKRGDVLFGRLRAYLRKYWLASFDGLCSTEIWPLIPVNERLVSAFLHLQVQASAFVEAAAVAYGTHMPRSDWSVLRKLRVALPPAPEQTAIAAALSDMDAELAALEARRDKTRALKQGMMQELLTGRTRLV